jgi:hypothetical protein
LHRGESATAPTWFLTTGGTVHVKQTATEKVIEVSVPKARRRELGTTIVLELDGPASEIVPLPFSSLTAGKSIKASSTFFNPAPPRNDHENAVADVRPFGSFRFSHRISRVSG